MITSVETALFELVGRAGTDEFKEMQRVVLEYAPNPVMSRSPARSSGYVLLEDGARFDGSLHGDAELPGITGEVVFNTSMTGYQEAVTDPSYAGQIITFTYPLIGNYGVAAQAMESDRVHARGVIMREAKNSEHAADAEGGWLDWLEDCGVLGDRRRRHPGAGPPHPRPRARCAAGSSRPSCPRRRRGSGSRPSRRWTAPTSRGP